MRATLNEDHVASRLSEWSSIYVMAWWIGHIKYLVAPDFGVVSQTLDSNRPSLHIP